jgi:uncharacterized hydrophobic protein (TIGR00271 family)
MFSRRVKPRGIIVVVEREQQIEPLLRRGYRLATVRGENLSVLVISDTREPPGWMQIPPSFDPQHISVQSIFAERSGHQIAKYVSAHPPILVVFSSEDCPLITQSSWNPELIDAVNRINCPVAILANLKDWENKDRALRYLVPYSGDEHSRFAVETALTVNPEMNLTVVLVGDTAMDEEGRVAFEQDFKEQLAPLSGDRRVTMKVLYGDDTETLLLEEVKHYDGILIGSRRGQVLQRVVFGAGSAVSLPDVTRKLIDQSGKPVLLVREYQGWLGSKLVRILATGDRLFPTLDRSERIDVYRQVRRAARPGIDFSMMIGLSAGIAVLGLVLNSPAVIIGAMLIAPLMSTIVAMGLAIVQGDMTFLLRSLRATLRGITIVVAVGIFIGIFYLDRIGTQEMLSRTEPTLLDLLVATASGVAVAYALCRKNVSAALPGVAIAVALVPPLAAVGLFLGMRDLQLAYGAFLLFLTNLAAITFASGVVFTLFGFRPPSLKEKDLRRVKIFQRSFLAAGLLLLAVFSHLTVLSVEDIAESDADNTLESMLLDHFIEGTGTTLVRWFMNDDDTVPEVFIHLSSSTDIDRSRLSTLVEQLSTELETPVRLTVTQIPSFSIDSTGVREKIEQAQQ